MALIGYGMSVTTINLPNQLGNGSPLSRLKATAWREAIAIPLTDLQIARMIIGSVIPMVTP